MVAALHARGLSGRSLARMLSAWRGFYRYLAEHHGLKSNPCVGIRAPKSPKRLPDALTPDEAQRLVEAPGESAFAVRDRAMLELFYSSGLRLMEFAGIDWNAIDMADGTARVHGKGAKTRVVPVGRHALTALRAWREARRAFPPRDQSAVFVNRLGRRLSTRTIQARVKAAGVKQGIGGMCIRTCCATPSPRMCCNRAAICAPCRRCSGTPALRRRRSIRTSTFSTLPKRTMPRTRARSENRSDRPVKALVLKPGREKSLLRRHPWVFSGAIEQARGDPASGDTVAILDHRGELLAHGAYSPQSQIRARVWSFDRDATIDAAFMHAAVKRAIEYRYDIAAPEADGVRLVHGESDGLPGLIVDRYADTAVMQCSSAGADRWRGVVADALVSHGSCTRVFERSDLEVRALEGLEERVGVVRGDEPPASISIREGDARYLVDVRHGQKTGFFLDQRENRAKVRQAAGGRDVLDVFCYTGGFTVAAQLGGARSVAALDSSAAALQQARENMRASRLDDRNADWIEGDAFATLRRLHGQGRRFDLIVLDPPKFAPTEKHVARAARAYKDVNLWALRLLRPNGLLYTFSCSGSVREELFQSIVAGAAVDAGVSCRIAARLGAAADHPVALDFPEGAYLKGFVLAAASPR